MWCRYNAVNSLQIPHNRHHIAHPWGMQILNLYSASETKVLYAISYCTGPCYSGTRLYRFHLSSIYSTVSRKIVLFPGFIYLWSTLAVMGVMGLIKWPWTYHDAVGLADGPHVDFLILAARHHDAARLVTQRQAIHLTAVGHKLFCKGTQQAQG